MDVNGDGVIINCDGGGVQGCEDNELGFMAWENGITSQTPGVFTNVGRPGPYLSDRYWSSTVDANNPDNAWVFDFERVYGSHGQGVGGKDYNSLLAWAVFDGDVAAVPIPAAVWFFGSGLLAIFGVVRRNPE